jgi:glyoxylase-like metal-dependent hydrolase (beta-lactamase superfamily II)
VAFTGKLWSVSEPSVVHVLAPNPGLFTLEGTNTWVVGTGPGLVIDPGPDDERHLEAVMDRAGTIGAILLTHHHADHASGAARLARMSGADVAAFSPLPSEHALRDGQVISSGDVALTAIHAPGHASDHVVFFHPEARALFTGDAVLGRGTSVIDPPDGDLPAYLESLDRMLALEPAVLYPGHGPTIRPAAPKLREYVEHRRGREREILRVLGSGAATPEEIVPAIYGDHPEAVHAAAARSVLAHLLKLEAERVVRRVSPGMDRFALSAPAGPDQPEGSATT